MRYKQVSISHNQYPSFIREGISFSDVYRTMAHAGILCPRPNVVLNYSESAGYTDYIRTISPLVLNEHLNRSVCFTLTKLERYPDGTYNISSRVLKNCNVSIVVARDKISAQGFEALKSLKAEWNARIIVDADDDLFSLPETHPEYTAYKKRLGRYKELLELADTITVSTKPVLDGIRKHTATLADASIIPNYLDGRIWSLKKPRRGAAGKTIRALYSGTLTHAQDLLLIRDALNDAGRELRRITDKGLELVVFGGSAEPIDGMHIIDVPDRCKSYPAFARWIQDMHAESPFQFAVAPLDSSNPLNVAKSNLKYLEYSAMGIPAIYTDILPYQGTVINKKTGLLVENSTSNWRDAILQMALYPDIAINIGSCAYEDVCKNHLLQQHFNAWTNILE